MIFGTIYFLIFNNVYITFDNIYDALEIPFLYNDIFISSLIYISILFFIEFILLLLGRLYFNKYKPKANSNYALMILYGYIFRFIPIVSHIGSFLLGMNNNKLIYNILIFITGFIFYLYFGYYFILKIF